MRHALLLALSLAACAGGSDDDLGIPEGYKLMTGDEVAAAEGLVVPEGGHVWIGPPIVDGESRIEIPVASKVCGSLVKSWNAVRISHPGWLCYDIYGNCVPITIIKTEKVSCENDCAAINYWTCTAYGNGDGTHEHPTGYPTASPDSTCSVPCNSESSCSAQCN